MFATSLYTHILEFGVTALIVPKIPVSARRPTAVYAWETQVMTALAKSHCLESSALLTALVCNHALKGTMTVHARIV
jgi:hypothetical protein